MALLAETPRRLSAVADAVEPALLRQPTGPAEWSANDILAHLRACADVRGGAIAPILEQDRPTFRAINPLAWIQQTDYLEQDFGRSLDAFARQRAELLARLKRLRPEEWQRSALVTGAGAPLERTVLFYADWVATHERAHYRQLDRIASALGG